MRSCVIAIVMLLIGLEAKAQTPMNSPMIAPLPGDSRPSVVVTPSPSLEQPAMVPVAPAPVYVADPLFATHERVTLPHASDRIWQVDLILGFPTALRVQRRIGDTRMWMEGGIMAFGDAGGFFTGLRWDARLYEGERNLLFVRPGVDLYFSPWYDRHRCYRTDHGFYAGTVDFDLNWQYRWSERFRSNVGLKIGLGTAIIGNSVYGLPVLGLTVGCHF